MDRSQKEKVKDAGRLGKAADEDLGGIRITTTGTDSSLRKEENTREKERPAMAVAVVGSHRDSSGDNKVNSGVNNGLHHNPDTDAMPAAPAPDSGKAEHTHRVDFVVGPIIRRVSAIKIVVSRQQGCSSNTSSSTNSHRMNSSSSRYTSNFSSSQLNNNSSNSKRLPETAADQAPSKVPS
jgi:hypothetical protein